jgi:hypothetical protein
VWTAVVVEEVVGAIGPGRQGLLRTDGDYANQDAEHCPARARDGRDQAEEAARAGLVRSIARIIAPGADSASIFYRNVTAQADIPGSDRCSGPCIGGGCHICITFVFGMICSNDYFFIFRLIGHSTSPPFDRGWINASGDHGRGA